MAAFKLVRHCEPEAARRGIQPMPTRVDAWLSKLSDTSFSSALLSVLHY